MRAVAWDLECSSLSGMIGRVLCCSFKPVLPDQSGEVYSLRGDEKPYRQRDIADDGKLVSAIRDELEKYDLLIGHNSLLFDKKFLNARLIKADQRILATRWHIDTMWAVRTNYRMSSKLDNVQKMLGLPDEKTVIDWDVWARGATYDKSSMDEIVGHCEKDVKVLEQAYWKLLPGIKTVQKR